jgi:hypothetical protein
MSCLEVACRNFKTVSIAGLKTMLLAFLRHKTPLCGPATFCTIFATHTVIGKRAVDNRTRREILCTRATVTHKEQANTSSFGDSTTRIRL